MSFLTSSELPPTPPEKLISSAAKRRSQLTSPTAQRVTTHTVQRVSSPSCKAMLSKLLTLEEEIKETQVVHGKVINALLKKQDSSVIEVPEGVVCRFSD